MRVNWSLIGICFLLLGISFLFAFTNSRHGAKPIKSIDVRFEEESPRFVSEASVNKLLIQNKENLPAVAQQLLVLKDLEKTLTEHPMLRKAEVYLTLDGTLVAELSQKKPILRFLEGMGFYLDTEGESMPLSDLYSARVPWVESSTGIKDLKGLRDIGVAINSDEFMNRLVTEVKEENGFILKIRQYDLVVELGAAERLQAKFANFKAFYQIAVKDSVLESYQKIDLRYRNQVVCTRK